MNIKWNQLKIIVVVLLFFMSCTTKKKEENPFKELLASIKKEYAPDKRVALFDIAFVPDNKGYVLKGESNLPKAVATLKSQLKADNIVFKDSIAILPSEKLKGKTKGLITISVANLRSKPKHSAELATQATLGTPVNVLKQEGEWALIQTPDKYLAWVDTGGIVFRTIAEFNQWKANKKIIYTKTYGHSYVDHTKTAVVSDLVAGNILELLKEEQGYYMVKYPDGRQAYVSKNDAAYYDVWLEQLNPRKETLVTTSKTMMGVPYLWGGTSTKGLDCSGFTKTIYFLNGMVIPRDASQQVHTGIQIDENKNFDKLEQGDLLFFGRKATDSTPEKVVHVGMWIGNNEFIHASGQVRISSMDPTADNYDPYNLNRYLRTKRILKAVDKDLIHLRQTPVFE